MHRDLVNNIHVVSLCPSCTEATGLPIELEETGSVVIRTLLLKICKDLNKPCHNEVNEFPPSEWAHVHTHTHTHTHTQRHTDTPLL